jgi:hypothetical protein
MPGHHQAPPYAGGMPGSYMQYDHTSQHLRQMESMNKTMMTMNMVGMGANLLSVALMPAMMFPFGGLYY